MTPANLGTIAAPLRMNVADRLAAAAQRTPDAIAVACAVGVGRYHTITLAALDADATRIAQGLAAWGVTPGTRLALLVRPGVDFVTLVFALLRAGAVIVLVDPGIGRKHLIRCLEAARPDGFVAIPAAHVVRLLVRRRFPQARWNVMVGRRWLWGGATLAGLRQRGREPQALPTTRADDPAAIIFTSGSTGPPKGVLYTQRMFDTQVSEIQAMYAIEPGRVDLSCFPLFALFNSAMGVTTVLPQMDFSRPASADSQELLAAANDWKVTQAFASPAVWRNLSAHCHKTGERVATLREIFSCGAPVPADVLRSTLAIAAPKARMHTPYGATECLPVATIEAAEVLGETAARTDEGAGVCVGRPFDSIEWRVIRITDEPLASIAEAEELPTGEIGELIVRGPQASPQYMTRMECNGPAKIADASATGAWHRMGDVGYLDEQGRFWYCGRKSHRVETAAGTLFTECVEAIFNLAPNVRRTALVGVGSRPRQTPVVVAEPMSAANGSELVERLIAAGSQNPQTATIRHFLCHPALPVDIRHNAKIHREALAEWAAKQLPELA